MSTHNGARSPMDVHVIDTTLESEWQRARGLAREARDREDGNILIVIHCTRRVTLMDRDHPWAGECWPCGGEGKPEVFPQVWMWDNRQGWQELCARHLQENHGVSLR